MLHKKGSKKAVALMFAAVMALTSVFAATVYASEAETASEMAEAVAYQGTVTVDGEVDEIWSKVPYTMVSHPKAGYWVEQGMENRIVQGTDYAAAGFQLLWNPEQKELYGLVTVLDYTISTVGDDTYNRDSVEVMIDEDNVRSNSVDENSAYLWTDAVDGRHMSETESSQAGVGEKFYRGFDSYVSLFDTGYVVEFCYRFTDITPSAGSYIGFDVSVTDDVLMDGGRMISLSWTGDDNIGKDPSMWGQILLSDENADGREAVEKLIGPVRGLKVEGSEEADVYQGTAVVDGEIDEIWDKVPGFLLANPKAGWWFEQNMMDQVKMGEDYAEALVRLLWDPDQKMLYGLITVKDKIVSTIGDQTWNKDSVEIWIDEDNIRGKVKTGDDGYLWTDAVDGRHMCESEDSTAELGDRRFPRMDSYTKLTEDGWLLEFCYRFETFMPVAGNYIGFDAAVADDAFGDGGRALSLSWTGDDDIWQDPTKWGQLRLLAENIEDYVPEVPGETVPEETETAENELNGNEAAETEPNEGETLESEAPQQESTQYVNAAQPGASEGAGLVWIILGAVIVAIVIVVVILMAKKNKSGKSSDAKTKNGDK